MKRLVLIAIITLMFTPGLFAANGTPWNQDYPCPDLDCSMTADGWADGMTSCSVKGGTCLTCATDMETNRAVCVKVYGSASCKCSTVERRGVRTCTASVRCNYVP
jgi:hypothetical protein